MLLYKYLNRYLNYNLAKLYPYFNDLSNIQFNIPYFSINTLDDVDSLY